MLPSDRLRAWEAVGASAFVRATRTLCQNLGHGYDHEPEGFKTFEALNKIFNADRVVKKYDTYLDAHPFLT